MSNLSLLVAASFGLAGALFCTIIIRVIYEALVGPRRGWVESWKIKQKEKSLTQLEQVIGTQDILSGFKSLRQFLIFDNVKFNPDLIERVSSLNFSVLSKIFDLTKAKKIECSEIEILEGLFSSRTAILRACAEILTNRNNLLRKRNNSMPSWAFDEYQKKLVEFSEQLETNRKSIELQLDRIYLNFQRPSDSPQDEIVYH
jgi:hypothetical protein